MILRIAALLVFAGAAYAQSSTKAIMYLSQFGYLTPAVRNPSSGALLSQDALGDAIREFQSFAGLNVTGDLDAVTVETMNLPRCGVKDKVGYGSNSRSKRFALQGDLDAVTVETMNLPRCGVKDKVGYGSNSRSKRFALQGSRWRVKDLTYRISKYPKVLSKQETDLEVKKAFNVWSEVTPLTFTKKSSGPVHIEIKFERGEHGDGDPFDGPGGTLAHAFFPVYGGDAHFDDAEKWTVNTNRGTNLFQVAAHEFGHSLGLSHSDVHSALMAPFYRGYQPSFQLDEDDVDAIQTLYGKSGNKPGKPSGTPSLPEPPYTPGDEDGQDAELCNDATVDTLFNSADGDTYAFKGLHYWKLTKESIASGYPKLISKSWPGLPGNIDAAFTYRNGKTYFFKGTQYWRYNGRKMDGTYPKPISEGFTGVPDNIDAAMVWSGNGKIYFFKGSKFWKFDPMQKPPVKITYPKPISNWEGIPNNLDAVLTYTNGWTYFFKAGEYYRFNDRSFAVDDADPPFPRPAGYWWFGCRSETKGGITGEIGDETNHAGDRGRYPGARDGDITDIILDGVDPMVTNINKGSGSGDCNSGVIYTSSLFLIILMVFALRL